MIMTLLTALLAPLYLYLMVSSLIVAKRSGYDMIEWLLGAAPLTIIFFLLVYKINC